MYSSAEIFGNKIVGDMLLKIKFITFFCDFACTYHFLKQCQVFKTITSPTRIRQCQSSVTDVTAVTGIMSDRAIPGRKLVII